MFSKQRQSWIVFPVGLLLLIVIGCRGKEPSLYKAQADEEVYSIMDQMWDPNFGIQANYRIEELNPGPNDINDLELPLSGQFSLADSVAVATAKNRDYLRQKESLYLSVLSFTGARNEFANRWLGDFDSGFNRNGSDDSLSSGSNARVSRLFADGASISLGLANNWSRFLTGSSRASLGSVLAGSISQPLMRGAGRAIVQENLTQAERNALYQIRSFSRFRQSFVVSIITDYYQVLQTEDTVTNAYNNYQRRQESQARLEMYAGERRIPWFEVDQAEQQTLSARDSWVRAEQNFEQRLDSFKLRMGLPTDTDLVLDPNELAALREIGIIEIDYTLDDAVEAALLARLDLANTADQLEDAERKVIVAENALQGSLNLTASSNVSSPAGQQPANLQFNQGNYAFGLDGDMPWDRVSQRNAYRSTLISLQQASREYENSVDTIKLDVRQSYRRLVETAERFRIQQISLELARKRVESTTLLIDMGRATTRDLLDAQDSLLLAENEITSALVDHAISKLNFYRDIGLLEVQPDGMWTKRDVAVTKADDQGGSI